MAFMGFTAALRARSAVIKTMCLMVLLLMLTACGYKADLTHPAAHTEPHTPAAIA